MKEIIKNSLTQEKEPPKGHQDRFLDKLLECQKPRNGKYTKFYRACMAVAAVGVLLIGIAMFLIPQSQEQNELYAIRKEILNSNLEYLEDTQNELLEIAKQKLPVEDYLEIYQMTQNLSHEYTALLALPSDMPHQEFIDCVRKNIQANSRTYYNIKRQLAKL